MNFFINILSVSSIFLVSMMSMAMLLSAFYKIPFNLGCADITLPSLPITPILKW